MTNDYLSYLFGEEPYGKVSEGAHLIYSGKSQLILAFYIR